MTPCFAEIIQSDLFTFLVDEDKTPVVVHAAAIAATSAQMDRLVNGVMKEAGERKAEIGDITVEDFARFCEYAYRGDYAVPVHRIDEDRLASKRVEDSSNVDPPGQHSDDLDPTAASLTDEAVQAEQTPVVDDWPVFGNKKSKTPKLSKRSVFRTKYHSRVYLSSEEHKGKTMDQFRPRCNTTDEQDFTPVFLAHARLYTFARMRLIDNLKALTLQKLHGTLISFRLYENRVQDIVELARYAYTSEYIPDRTEDGSTDDLRDLVVNYIASEFDCIGRAPVFLAFLEEGGEFVGDFCSTVLNELL